MGVPIHDPRPIHLPFTDQQSAVINAGLNMQGDRFRSAVKFATGKERVEDLNTMECALAVAQLRKIHK